MKKNGFIREKNIKLCYSNKEPKGTNVWKILYSNDNFYIYTVVTKERQTFRKIKKQYMDVYKELLKVRKRLYQITSKGRMCELHDEYKRELNLEFELLSVLKYIKSTIIDIPLVSKSVLSKYECDFNKNDLKFIQLLLLSDGIDKIIPGLKEEERVLILRKNNRYTI